MKSKNDYDDFDLPEIDYNSVVEGLPEGEYEDDDFLSGLSESLGAQVNDELGTGEEPGGEEKPPKKKKKYLTLKIIGGVVGFVVLFALFLVFTTPGRRLGTRIAAKFIHSAMDTEITAEATPTPSVTEAAEEQETNVFTDFSSHRNEEYVVNYLIFGIEEIGGGSNTDAMILVSLNTKDNTIKMTSFLRDTYVTIPGYKRNKLNSAYARGGAELLVEVLENTYDMEISGYASVNFSAFESIIDRLGGIDIELGSTEASYLRRTNYISKIENRTVQEGWNHLNGNQALGYCRVRKVPTLGGAANDYGRTLRQRRVINAIIQQYKSASYFEMLSIAQDILGFVKTNITEDQIADALFNVIENEMYTTESLRLPADNLFYDSGKAGINGITYALVIDDHREENIELFHQFLFLDPTPTPEPTVTEEASEAP